jgi:RNA polymerase sigma factor (TIGR02999 family)
MTVELIRAAREGDRDAVDRLFSLAYDELRHLARLVRRRGAGQTLNTTALVHEAYLKLQPERGLSLVDRAHFTYVVARAMRQVVVDAARRRLAAKRGGDDAVVTLDESISATPVRAEQLIRLEETLRELEQADPRRAKIVECRFFGGLTVEETAHALGISAPTVKRDWRVARAWLAQSLTD